MKQIVHARWSAVAIFTWLALGNAGPAHADVGPIDPARKICMGSPAGTPCSYQGQQGTCQGPHASRMYCTPGPSPSPAPDKPKPADPLVDAKPEPVKPVVDAAVPPAPVVPAPVVPPAKKKSGCSVSSSQQLPNALLVVSAIVGVGLGAKRRRKTSDSQANR